MKTTSTTSLAAHLTMLSLTLLAILMVMAGWPVQTGQARTESVTMANFAPSTAATRAETIPVSFPQAACGFVNPPADPSPMDCYTALVANHDDFALGTRTPVILIHGIHGNADPADGSNFANLIASLNSNATFRERFKIYRFHYRSDYLPVYQIARSLRNRIDDLVKQGLLPESKKFVLIAHSMGGLVARSYMNEHDTDFGNTFGGQRGGKRISKLLALATPHHGTTVANDRARISGHAAWGLDFDIFDFVYWDHIHHCSDCNDDPSHPNRSDLRFDNFNGLWINNPDYLNDPKEQNGWLRDLPKTYDTSISAYFGYIGGAPGVSTVGQLGPGEIVGFLLLYQDDLAAVQIGTGVLITKVDLNDFDSPIFFLNNDGLVSTDSGMYKNATVGKRIQCAESDHDDMKNGTGGNCTVLGTSINKPLFALVIDDLLSISTGSSDTQVPSVTITSPTSNSTFNTSSGSINLGGSASDNVGVTSVTWTNSRGGSGNASGTTSWSISGIGLQSGSNILTVRAQDAAGNIGSDTLTVNYTVSTTDTAAPTVSISAPTASSTYNTSGSTLTLRGTATDNVGVVQVTCSNNRGGNCSVSGTTNWTGSVTGLQSGSNVLTVRATDAAGNAGTKSLTVNYSVPSVCDGGTSVNYRMNGSAPIHPNGTLIKLTTDPTVYVLQNGQKRGIPSQAILNTLYLNGGFANKDVITIAADESSRYPTGAVVTASLPSNGRSQPEGRLIKQVGGAEISIVTNNGHRRPFTSEGAFLGLGYLYCNVIDASDYNSYPADAPADAITILTISSITPSAIQTRDWGGSVTYTFTVTDALGAPVSGAIVGGQDNLMGIGVFIATTSTDSNGRGTWTTTVPNGAQNALFDVMFLSEKTGYTKSPIVTRQVQVNHFFDTSAPSISISSPTTATVFNTNSGVISLAGTASDNVGVTQVTWVNDRGGSGTASGSSNWTVNGITLQSGANVLTVTARDAVGNIGTTRLTAIYTPQSTDTTPPSITITSPTTALNYQTNVGQLGLGGTATDNAGVTQVVWTNDRGGNGAAGGTTNWTINGISLQTGFNVITVVALDGAGNVDTAVLIANYTTSIAPTVTTTSASSVTTSTVTLGANVNPNGLSTLTWFEWGTDPTLGSNTATPQQSSGSGSTPLAVTTSLTGLNPNTAYYFRAVAASAAGTNRGLILSFITELNQPATTNFARVANGGVASASTTTPNSQFPGYNFVPAVTIDGDRRGGMNFWRDDTASVYPDWLQVDFLGSKNITEIDVFTVQDNDQNTVEPTQATTFSLNGITAFDVQYWTGSAWITVPNGSVTGNNKVWRQFTFSPIATSKIRVLVNNALNTRSRIVELEAWGTSSNGTNQALAANGGMASASTTTPNSQFPGYNFVPSVTIDGDRRGGMNFWRDDTASVYPDWLQVDFNSSKNITEIDVFTAQDNDQNTVEPTQATMFSLYGITAFEVQYWTGLEWITVPNGSVTGNNKVWRQFTFSPIATSKIRVLVNNALNTRSRIVELEAWGTSSNGSNQALAANGGVASASTTTPNSQFPGYNFVPGVTIDGDRRGGMNFWRDDTANAYPDWLQVDFNGSKNITEVDVFTVQDDDQHSLEPTLGMTFSLNGITAFDVQYWTGSAWITVPNGSVTGNNKVWRQFTFSPIATSKIRVLVNNALNTRSRIVELEAY